MPSKNLAFTLQNRTSFIKIGEDLEKYIYSLTRRIFNYL